MTNLIVEVEEVKTVKIVAIRGCAFGSRVRVGDDILYCTTGPSGNKMKAYKVIAIEKIRNSYYVLKCKNENGRMVTLSDVKNAFPLNMGALHLATARVEGCY